MIVCRSNRFKLIAFCHSLSLARSKAKAVLNITQCDALCFVPVVASICGKVPVQMLLFSLSFLLKVGTEIEVDNDPQTN